MNQKYYQKMYDANVNVNSVIEDVTQIKIGIMVTVDVSVKIKKKHCVRKTDYLVGILLRVVVKMVNMYEVIFLIQ